jgi:micrococcal nuclease
VNRLLVEEGYAEIMTVPPDVSKSKEFLAVQQTARIEKKGLWGFCSSTKF